LVTSYSPLGNVFGNNYFVLPTDPARGASSTKMDAIFGTV
jgi:hypothetical protein